MDTLVRVLVALSAVAFLVAVAVTVGSTMKLLPGVPAEGYSRASSNLALLAIALSLRPRSSAK
jgi:hypothetical protein